VPAFSVYQAEMSAAVAVKGGANSKVLDIVRPVETSSKEGLV
jgi:hypothetical protein